MNLEEFKKLLAEAWEKNAPSMIQFIVMATFIEVILVLMLLPLSIMLKLFF